eukprot:TRINITY_DN4497_c1_g3_i1.p1 TRINITY_DN4497_c1_g3~~TRINITY_DN4497_c1_g3_i1.p1  ORF type:complete len:753 (+),score=209.53 TRINITY_DN4497_c1_g3_i1:89-2347(+)
MHIQRHGAARTSVTVPAAAANAAADPAGGASPPAGTRGVRAASGGSQRVVVICVAIAAAGIPVWMWSRWEAARQQEEEGAAAAAVTRSSDSSEALRKTEELRNQLRDAERRLLVLERQAEAAAAAGAAAAGARAGAAAVAVAGAAAGAERFSAAAPTLPVGTGESGQLGDLLKPITVSLFSDPDCSGKTASFTPRSELENCRGCFDTCSARWQGGDRVHPGGAVRSARVSGPGILLTDERCIGRYKYPGVTEAGGKPYSAADGCINFPAGTNKEHFKLKADRQVEERLKSIRALVADLAALQESPKAKGSAGLPVVMPPASGRGLDDPVSRFADRDWMPPRTIGEVPYYRNWTNRFQTPEMLSGERTQPCGDPVADGHNARGVELVRNHLEFGNYPAVVKDPAEAEEHFLRAIEVAPRCVAANLNLAITMFSRLDRKDLHLGVKYAEAARDAAPDSAKPHLWCAIYYELMQKWRPSTEEYLRAFEIDSTLPLRYFGRPHKSWGRRSVPPEPRIFFDPNEATMRNQAAHEAQEDGMRKLLLYSEFAPYFGGYGALLLEQGMGFLDKWYIQLGRLIPPYCIKVVQEVYRPMIRKGWMRWDGMDARRHTHHNGPMQRFLQAGILQQISRVAGYSLIPTYVYMGAYWGHTYLRPHLDREQCEYTLSITVDAHPEAGACGLGVADQPNKVPERGYSDSPFRRNVLPPEANRILVPQYLGDGALIRGRAVLHWRETDAVNCTQFFFHYVLDSFTGDLN